MARTQIARGLSEARKLEAQIAQVRQQARREALDELAKAEAQAILRAEEVAKASQRNAFQRLFAPTTARSSSLPSITSAAWSSLPSRP